MEGMLKRLMNVDVAQELIEETWLAVKTHAQENPALVSFVFSTSLFALGMLMMQRGRKVLKRDGSDFNSVLGGCPKLLNNSDMVVDKETIASAVSNYEHNYANAQEISSKSSVAARNKNYASMVDNFYTVVTGGFSQIQLSFQID